MCYGVQGARCETVDVFGGLVSKRECTLRGGSQWGNLELIKVKECIKQAAKVISEPAKYTYIFLNSFHSRAISF